MLEDPTAELAELRQANERLRRKLDFLFDRLGLVYADDDVPLYVLHAQELIRAGQYGDALRVVREHTAVGIREARAMTIDMAARLGVPVPTDQQLGAVTTRNAWEEPASYSANDDPAPSHWTLSAEGTFEPVTRSAAPPKVDAASIWRD